MIWCWSWKTLKGTETLMVTFKEFDAVVGMKINKQKTKMLTKICKFKTQH